MKYQSLIIESRKKRIDFPELKAILAGQLSINLSEDSFDKLEISKEEDKNSIGIKEVENISAWTYQKNEN